MHNLRKSVYLVARFLGEIEETPKQKPLSKIPRRQKEGELIESIAPTRESVGLVLHRSLPTEVGLTSTPQWDLSSPLNRS